MIRTTVVGVTIALFVWAPWMDASSTGVLAERVLSAFGPMPSACYDSDDTLLQEGLEIRWYPLGRILHTCSGDYVAWFWGSVKELGGVHKSADDIRPVRSRPFTCAEVLERQESRRSTSTNNTATVLFTGTPASDPDTSIFPEMTEYTTVLREALHGGPTFAGRFAVAEWECGSACQNHAVIDVESGLVVSVGPQTEHGIAYALDSTLLITNPVSALPSIPESTYEAEGVALGIARLPREYYRLTTDALSGTQYLVRECVESSATGYIELEDDRLDIVRDTPAGAE